MQNFPMKLLFVMTNFIALNNLPAMEPDDSSAKNLPFAKDTFERQLSLCEAFITGKLWFESSYVNYDHYQNPTTIYAASAKRVLKDLKQASKLVSSFSREDSMGVLVGISIDIINSVATNYKKPVKEAVAQLPALVKLLAFDEKYMWIYVMLKAESQEKFAKVLGYTNKEDFFTSRFELIQALKQSDSALITQRIKELKHPKLSEQEKAVGLEVNKVLENFVLMLHDKKKKEKVSVKRISNNNPDCAIS